MKKKRTMYRELSFEDRDEDIERLKFALFFVVSLAGILFHSIMIPHIPFKILEWIQKENPILQNWVKIYPVIVEHSTYAKPQKNQIPVYSSITSGGSGGITKNFGFHTLTDSDTLYISYLSSKTNSKKKSGGNEKIQNHNQTRIWKDSSHLKTQIKTRKNPSHSSNQKEKISLKIPANYRFRNDFALRWDHSPAFAIASVQLKGYRYFRDMLRQIRENFAPPGLNLMWRDSAGVVISQPIKPQIVRVLFLLDTDGTVRDVKIISSMGQKPVDEACIRALLHQNFGPPPPEIFEHGNIFGINFIFPPLD